ncbi:hypothetical protein JOD17_004071 [Geomicrobium sediminis]|uniref:Uncharacterized protein n=1 Tax=Geomicrobium sediminis TaxID=1347788 RepID=A0ABS2PHN1_9BACL|nr:hypothetical protein [Geomicrobium sediminis]
MTLKSCRLIENTEKIVGRTTVEIAIYDDNTGDLRKRLVRVSEGLPRRLARQNAIEEALREAEQLGYEHVSNRKLY